MAQALSLIAHDDLASQVKALEEDGYVYFPGVLDSGEMTQLRAAMDRLEPIAASYDRADSQANGQTFVNKVINNSFNRDPLYLSYLDRAPIVDVAEAIHGDDCHCLGMQSWLTGPGRPDQNLHTDWLPLALPEHVLADPQVKIPIFITTAHYYLDDMYEELGPTKFVPGSHFSGRSPEGDISWKGRGEESILCRAGDVVMFRSEVWHRGSANNSQQTRYLLQVHYSKRMISQKYPPYLGRFAFDQDILARANERQRRLLGDHRPSNYD